MRVMVDNGVELPRYAHEFDAGMDLCATEGVTLAPHETRMVGTGVRMEIPEGMVGLLLVRSGTAMKKGLSLANGVGVIDSEYRGEIRALMHNGTYEPQEIVEGERILQLVIMEVKHLEIEGADELGDTARGADGFGSTGSR